MENETPEARLFLLCEQLQTEARSLQNALTGLYKLASQIKQEIVSTAVNNSTPEGTKQ